MGFEPMIYRVTAGCLDRSTNITSTADTVRFTAPVSDWSEIEAVNFFPCGAFSEIRTHYLVLTKNALFQMSYEGLIFE